MSQNKIIIRKYRPDDVSALANIFYNTVHQINIQHYTQEQVDVWAPEILDLDKFRQGYEKMQPFVATIDDELVGFAEFEPNGHINCFYCHHEWIGQGVGKALMNAIIEQANQEGIKRIFAEVSITAKPFFEKCGFTTITEQTVIKKGVGLINYQMEKLLK